MVAEPGEAEGRGVIEAIVENLAGCRGDRDRRNPDRCGHFAKPNFGVALLIGIGSGLFLAAFAGLNG